MLLISASLEDYLEGIFFIQEAHGRVRVVDLADFLDVKKPSVVKSLIKLKDLGLIDQQPYQDILLTKKGLTLAKKISQRHSILKDFFTDILKVDEKTAEEDACRIEHAISTKTFEQFKKFIKRCKKGAML